MTAFLLTWNPKVWSYDELRALIDDFGLKGEVEAPWRIMASKQATRGDRVFFLTKGPLKRHGIFASGTLLDKPTLRDDPSDGTKKRRRANVHFDRLVDPVMGQLLIPLEELQEVVKGWHLAARGSGQGKLPEEEEKWILDRLASLPRSGKVIVARSITGRPTTGPAPITCNGSYSRSADQPGTTYAFRFHNRNVWKIGFTSNLVRRLDEVNKHLPHEVTGERWIGKHHQVWSKLRHAHEMEQAVLRELKPYRTEGERLICPSEVLEAAWNKVVFKMKKHGVAVRRVPSAA